MAETQNEERSPLSFFLLNVLRLCMILLICGIYLFKDDTAGWEKGFVIGAMAVFTADHLLFQLNCTLRSQLILIGIDSLMCLLLGFLFLESSNFMIIVGVIAVTLYLATEDRRIRYGWVAFMLLGVVGIVLRQQFEQKEVELFGVMVNVGYVLFSGMVGSLIRYYSDARTKIAQLYGALERSHAELRESADEIERLTLDRERNRIAREIHDTVGHKMTALLVQLQAARKLQEREPERSRETLLRCEDLARSALQEVRFSVKAIREDGLGAVSFVDSLRKLCEEFAGLTGMSIDFVREGEAEVTKPLQLTLFRVLQESLTNAQKHGNAATVRVLLYSRPHETGIVIEDDGSGTGTGAGAQAEIVPGFGLMNMEERVNEQNGTFRAHRLEQGGVRVAVSFSRGLSTTA